jgi:hypothetical protein
MAPGCVSRGTRPVFFCISAGHAGFAATYRSRRGKRNERTAGRSAAVLRRALDFDRRAENDAIAVIGGLAIYVGFVLWLHPLLIGIALIVR